MSNLLVLDKEEYKKDHSKYLSIMKSELSGDNRIVYTSYEDSLIRKVRNIKIIGSALQHILYWKKSYSYAKKITQKRYGNIYCLNPIVGVFLGLLNKEKKSSITLCGFLFEPKKNQFYYRLRKKVTEKALSNIKQIVVYGSNEVEYYKTIFPKLNFVFVKYGIDFDNSSEYTNQVLPESYFFSGGGSNRDYHTLVTAYNEYRKCGGVDNLVIATQPWRLNDFNTEHIIVLSDVVNETFGDVLKKSKVLVLSLKSTKISAGHMVMFQAMSLGIPVIVNDIPAIRDYVDEQAVTFYKSKETKELSALLRDYDFIYDDMIRKASTAKRIYKNELCFDEFVRRILRL